MLAENSKDYLNARASVLQHMKCKDSHDMYNVGKCLICYLDQWLSPNIASFPFQSLKHWPVIQKWQKELYDSLGARSTHDIYGILTVISTSLTNQ